AVARASLCRRVLSRHHSAARLALLRNASRPGGGHGGQRQQTEQAIKRTPTRLAFRMRHRRSRRPPKRRSRRSPPANRRRRRLRAQVRRLSGSTPSGRSKLVACVDLQRLTARLCPAGEQAIFSSALYPTSAGQPTAPPPVKQPRSRAADDSEGPN